MMQAKDDSSDISTINLLPGKQSVCFIIKGLFSMGYCQQLKQKAIEKGFTSANDKYPSSYRNNERLVEDNKTLAQVLYNACKPYIPNRLNTDEGSLTVDSLNERLRYCKYSQQQYFSIHRDGIFYKDNNKHSILTFLLYLNGHEEFSGGATDFYNDQCGTEVLVSYKPSIGDIAVFDHKIWHSGTEVNKGSKYILRSDFIYLKKAPKKQKIQQQTINTTVVIFGKLPK